MKPVLLALVATTLAPAMAGADLDAPRLQSRLRQIEARLGTGRIGVGVRDLSTGQTILLNGNKRFPMQSTFKMPLAVAVLALVDRGQLSLDRRITITSKDLSVPFSRINDDFKGQPRAYTVRELLNLSAGESDNTAADVLLRLVGGPAKVTQVLRSVGVQGLRIDRYEHVLQMNYTGLGPFRPAWSRESVLQTAISRVPKTRAQAALRAYLVDPRDTSTPQEAVVLLADLQAGRLLSAASTQLLLRIMTESRTGPDRLTAGLPKGWSLAHKTGTGRSVHGVEGTVNDMGVVTMPNGGRVAIVVFVAGARGPRSRIEKGIADVARAVVVSEMRRGTQAGR